MQVEPPGRLLSSAPTPIRIAQPSEEIRLQLLLALWHRPTTPWVLTGGEGQPDFFPKRCCHDPQKIQPWTWKSPEKPVCHVLPDALLSVLSVFFRKIFVLQLVGLVLTYNFIDCDFEKIRRKYQEVIYQALEKYMDGPPPVSRRPSLCCPRRSPPPRSPADRRSAAPAGPRPPPGLPPTVALLPPPVPAPPVSRRPSLCCPRRSLPPPRSPADRRSAAPAGPRPPPVSRRPSLCCPRRSLPPPPPGLPPTVALCPRRSPPRPPQPDCLARIERLTLHRIRGCASGAREAFAEGTVAALAAECPGYAAAPINNTQAKKKRKKREVTTNKCREQVAHLIGLWRRFSRIS
ncbi:unnamed protein product [Nyctereutes procyonoides]|uniref:(raccoon dog) hypothetical protein n=1 Tax=Nyctereutes procyonoides TaxID=34880 RepID=A0A811Y0G7_NYCPR|nr:unnamed protein product [Nyctereutes procyonoides]